MADVRIFDDKKILGKQAALCAAQIIRAAISRKGYATIVLATGSSQIQMLAALVGMPDIDWSVVRAFHLDEYIGLNCDHKASFRHYLRERFLQPLGEKSLLHEIDGSADPRREIQRLSSLILDEEIDVIFTGIGDNCHLAFNDPPADFDTDNPYLLVNLDEVCRRQQVRGGWFANIADVPRQAITMSINQIMKGKQVILLAYGEGKSGAVYHALEGEIDNDYPASILQRHDNVIWFLDSQAAMLL